MRLESIEIAWFRGGAESALLEPGQKSVVVYGENAAGKSSFVDAVEYVIRSGKIAHLSHEYSGKRMERAIISTHMPPPRPARVRPRRMRPQPSLWPGRW